MKTLYTCGDSYLSVDDPPGEVTSFLELFARYKNFQHVSLARAGATCFTIRVQIDHAIANAADYVIVGCTSSDRLDVPLAADQSTPWFELGDIHYQGYRCASARHVPSRPRLISDTVYNHLHDTHHTLGTDVKNSIKHWVSHLHDPSLQRQQNYYMMADGLRRLKDCGIPFVYIPHGLGHMDWTWVERMWPLDRLPCHMPRGPYDYTRSVTHNDQASHDEFFQQLVVMTEDWH